MTQPRILTGEMLAAIGKETPPATNEVDNTGCRQFARAVGYTDPIYYDAGEAHSRGYRGIVAPFGFLGHRAGPPATTPNTLQALGLDAIPLKRILNGGTELEYLDDVCSGDVLTSATKLADLTEREGKMGPMVMVSLETSFRNQAGKLVAVQRGTMILY